MFNKERLKIHSVFAYCTPKVTTHLVILRYLLLIWSIISTLMCPDWPEGIFPAFPPFPEFVMMLGVWGLSSTVVTINLHLNIFPDITEEYWPGPPPHTTCRITITISSVSNVSNYNSHPRGGENTSIHFTRQKSWLDTYYLLPTTYYLLLACRIKGEWLNEELLMTEWKVYKYFEFYSSIVLPNPSVIFVADSDQFWLTKQ